MLTENFTAVKVQNDWGKQKSGAKWIELSKTERCDVEKPDGCIG